MQWNPAQLLSQLHLSSILSSQPNVVPPLQPTFTRTSRHCLGTFTVVNLALTLPFRLQRSKQVHQTKSILTQCPACPGFVYPVASRWAWAEEGWLNQMGYRDFSGCGPVHLLGGTCSLFGAWFLGPRLGRFSSRAEDSQEMPGHSVPVSSAAALSSLSLGVRGFRV
jgi:ammonia channel protein AmtB